ncbi:serine/threonine-protein kinase [Streptomyces sp. NPDC054863]
MTLLEGDPREIGGYLLEGRLGAGGMGVVYRGRSVSGRQVAVKVIRPDLAEDAGFRARFRQEVAAARRVSGAFTAAVVDADPDARAPWFATLFVPGPSLAQRVSGQGPLDVAEVRRLAAGLVEALRDIHRVGLVHRDLKPGNVLLAADGPRVIDFGIARTSDAVALTSTGVAVGTPPFMAPEQFRRETVTGAADIFALGAVLVYAATGHGPFDGDSVHAVGFRVVYEEPDLAGLPEELRELVEPCLAKEPGRRVGVPGLLAVLGGAAERRGDGGPPVPAPTEVPTPTEVATPVPVPTPTQVDGAGPGPTSGPGPVPAPFPAAPAQQPPVAERSHQSPAFATAPTQVPAQVPVPAWPTTRPPTPRPGPSRRRRTLIASTAVVVLALVAGAAVVVPDLFGRKGDEGPGQGTGASVSAGAGQGGRPGGADVPSCAPGSGRTFRAGGASVQRIAMERWLDEYKKRCDRGGNFSYGPSGSGAGIDRFFAEDLELAVTNAPLTKTQESLSAKRCGPERAVQLPLNVLPIAVAVNLPGVDSLVLSAKSVARIFDGRITRWNAPEIVSSNPGTFLPDTPVTLLLPTDESPTTLAFTEYLAGAAPANWRHAPAVAVPVPAPGGPGAPVKGQRSKDLAAGLAGVAGGITFLPLTEAKDSGADVVRLVSGPGGTPVAPDERTAAKAVAVARQPGSIGHDPVGLDHAAAARTPGAYSLVQMSYAVVCARNNEAAALPVLRAFLQHALSGPGQRSAAERGYGTLPAPLTERVRKTVRELG